MNKETGEIVEIDNQDRIVSLKGSARATSGVGAKVPVDWIRLSIGDVIEIKCVKCKLINVNPGKRRLTFQPLDNTPIPT